MNSMKVMTHGYPLYMVAYGLGFIPLIKHLKLAYPDVTQHWYVDDAGTIGIFDNIGLHLNFFFKFVPGRGYYPKPPKKIYNRAPG